MIVKDLRNIENKKINIDEIKKVNALTSKDVFEIWNLSDSREWNLLGEKIEKEEVYVGSIKANDLLDKDSKYNIIGDFLRFDTTMMNLLKNVDAMDSNSNTLATLFSIENPDSSYKEILKVFVDSTNAHKDMYFFDYEDNNYSSEASRNLITKIMDIDRNMLYPTDYSLMFKTENFKPTFITNMTNHSMRNESEYEKAEFDIILY